MKQEHRWKLVYRQGMIAKNAFPQDNKVDNFIAPTMNNIRIKRAIILLNII